MNPDIAHYTTVHFYGNTSWYSHQQVVSRLTAISTQKVTFRLKACNRLLSKSKLIVITEIRHKRKINDSAYDKQDGFNFSIVNFPYLCSNIPASPVYGVYISQLILYARACSTYDQFLVWGSLLTKKLMTQGFQMSSLQAAFRKLYGRYNYVIYPYNLSLGHMLSDIFHNNR
jgi:hypothetical protein